MSADIDTRAHEWISGGDTGTSSIVIWRHMMGLPKGPGWRGKFHPLDPADLGRCLRLLERIPEWKPRIGELAGISPQWSRLVARWDEVSQAMSDEVGIDWSKGREAPKTYALMKELGL